MFRDCTSVREQRDKHNSARLRCSQRYLTDVARMNHFAVGQFPFLSSCCASLSSSPTSLCSHKQPLTTSFATNVFFSYVKLYISSFLQRNFFLFSLLVPFQPHTQHVRVLYCHTMKVFKSRFRERGILFTAKKSTHSRDPTFFCLD